MSAYKQLLLIALIAWITETTSATRCPYCNVDYNTLGRHTWRCKARVTSSDTGLVTETVTPANSNDDTTAGPSSTHNPSTLPLDSGNSFADTIQCMCGKKCKGKRGLKAHQRSCATFRALVNKDYSIGASENETDQESTNSKIGPQRENEKPMLPKATMDAKAGIILPKTKSRWEEANLYFKSVFLLSEPVTNLD
jgi:hypothetical protein